MKKVGIIIVNYNGEKYQNDCLKSLYSMDELNFEVIIVDSGSTDHSIELVKKDYPDVVVLEQNDNVGFAKGSNIGIQYAIQNKFEYSLLINNDVVVDRLLLNKLLECADEETVIVPKIYYYKPNKLIWYAGGNILWNKGNAEHIGIQQVDQAQYDECKYVSYASGCCMLINNKIFKQVGLLDENVFMYYEDADFCVRLLDAGKKILYQPEAVLWHKVSSSTGGEHSKLNVYYMFRNQLYFIEKHKKHIGFRGKMYVKTRAITKLVLSVVKNKNNRYIAAAYKDYLCSNMGKKDF